MRNCLLCSQVVEENRTFSSLILLQFVNIVEQDLKLFPLSIAHVAGRREKRKFARIVKYGKRKAIW